MILTLLRHGEVEGRAQVLRGRSDPLLSEYGQQQLRRAVDSIDTPVTALACSPLQRCKRFAHQQAEALQVPLSIIDSLREIDFGAWEELTLQEAEAHDAQCFARFQHDTVNWCPPNGEAYAAFRIRVRDGLRQLCNVSTSHLLVITHGGVIRALLAELLDLSPASAARFGVPLAGIAQLWIDDAARHNEPIRGSLLRLHWLESFCSKQ